MEDRFKEISKEEEEDGGDCDDLTTDLPSARRQYQANSAFLSQVEAQDSSVGEVSLRARWHYVTKPSDIGHMTVWITFDNGLGTLKTKSVRGVPGRGMCWVCILS